MFSSATVTLYPPFRFLLCYLGLFTYSVLAVIELVRVADNPDPAPKDEDEVVVGGTKEVGWDWGRGWVSTRLEVIAFWLDGKGI